MKHEIIDAEAGYGFMIPDRKAIAAEPALWSAHAQLGVNLMRLAREEDARAELELAVL